MSALVLASLGAGWVGALGAVRGGREPVVVSATATTSTFDGAVVVAGEQAQAAVVAWLTASDARVGDLDRFFSGVGQVQLPERGAVVSNAAVASVVPRGPGLWSVTVAADVVEPGARAVRRYLQVPVVVSPTAEGVRARVAALPAPVPAPVPGARVSNGYTASVDVSTPAAAMVASFVGALTTGVGDIARYESPGVLIAPISPPIARSARLTALEVGDIDAEAVAGAAPGEGAQVRVLATVQLEQSARQVRTCMYALTIRARGGRWEVAAIDPTPSLVMAGASSASPGVAPRAGDPAPSGSGGPQGPSSQSSVTPSGVTVSK